RTPGSVRGTPGNRRSYRDNQYQPVLQAKPYTADKPLQPLQMQLRFKAPEGSQPYGLAWFAGSLYMSSYKTAAGIYQLDPEDGRVINRDAPDITYKEQYGGLAADKEQLYHVQGQFSNDCNPLDPATLEPKDKFFLYSSQFHLGDLTLHNNHLYAIGYHRSDDVNDYRLLKFSLDGKLRRSIAITVIPNRSASPGLASDGRWLYTSMGDALYKLDPETGDVVEGFAVPDAFYGIAYDGEQLWGAGWNGNVYSFVVK
ncbi:MAG: hypothetical protein IBX47_13225, partial [Desulfuromonadales bacterium]|nr:hypothetical protein [Desulfuromonadales bacterium]